MNNTFTKVGMQFVPRNGVLGWLEYDMRTRLMTDSKLSCFDNGASSIVGVLKLHPVVFAIMLIHCLWLASCKPTQHLSNTWAQHLCWATSFVS